MKTLLLALVLACAAVRALAQPMVVAVRVNAEDLGEVFAVRAGDDFLLRQDDLARAGLRLGPAPRVQAIDGEPHVSLRSLQGVTFTFDERALRLDVQADPSLLARRTLDFADRRRFRATPTEHVTGFLNYAVEQAQEAGTTAGLRFSGEAGLRVGKVLLLSNGATVQDAGGARRFVRLMSSAIRDDTESLQRLVVGDFFAAPTELGNGANLAGVSLTKLYSLDPYVVRYPLGNLRAQIALPSDVDVYVDGQRVRSERVRPGEVEIRDLYGYGGARNVQLVVRDAFGRVQQLDYSAYFSDQPLRQGLHEYSYNAGWLRRNYGVASNDYGPPAYSIVHRYGVSDAVTLGFSSEGRREAMNGGPTATVVLGNAGVVSAALSASDAQGRRGWAGALRYNYQRSNFSAGFSLRRESAGYAMLTDPLALFNRKREVTVGASYSWGSLGVLSVNHSRLDVQDAVPLPGPDWQLTVLEPRRVTTIGYTAPVIPGRASLNANLSRVHDRLGPHTEFAVGLTVFMDAHRTLRAFSQRIGEVRLDTLQAMQPPPIGEGWGWDVAAERVAGAGDEALNLKASAQLNLAKALLRIDAGHVQTGGSSHDNYRLTAAGSVAFVGGGVHFGRPVTDSYALVRVANLAGVPASVNGQPVGRTDAKGELFVPSLASYNDNQVTIDPRNLPIEYSVARVERKVAPPLRAGVVVDFDARRMQAITGRLVAPDGTPLSVAEIELPAGAGAVRSTTGRAGELYLENLGAGSHEGRARLHGDVCRFRIEVPGSDELFVEVGSVTCR